MRHFAFIVILFSCFAASAADRITATISVTNAPLGNTNTLVVNGSTRTFTNTVTGSPATLIQQTNSIPWSATNILAQITDYRFSQFHFLSQTASTNFLIVGAVGEALTVTLAGGWGKVVYSTQTVSSPTFLVRVPMTVEQTSNRTHIASLLVQGQSDNSTNSFATNAVAMSNYVTKGASAVQRISSPLQVSGQLGVSIASITNASLYNATNRGYVVALTNGYWTNATLDSATITNLSVPGSGSGSVKINGTASGDFSLTVGGTASGYSSTAIGIASTASSHAAVALGTTATASATNALALGTDATAAANNSIAIGAAAGAADADSIAIGTSASTDTTNQIVLGSSSYKITIPGRIEGAISTNGTFKGTNIINGRVDFTSRANTSLANGNNAGVVLGTNVYVRMSGPSASYTINGIAAEVDGSWHIAEFANPVNSLIIADNSGTDPAAANRIRTGTGADVTFTNNPVVLQFIYNASDARWKIVNWFR